MKESIKDRLLYVIFGGIAVLIGGYFIKMMWGHERYSIPSKIRGIPYLVFILGLFTLAYGIFGTAKKTEESKPAEEQTEKQV